MIENSSAGLVMLNGEVPVTVTREEHHQSVLARYPVAVGAQRHVAVELGWCTIASGKYRGQPAIEIRLDGRRIGELTHAMSQRYAPLLTQVATHGGRTGCEAVIQRETKGLQVILRLPRNASGTILAHAPATPAPPEARRRSVFSSHRPAWIAAAIIAIAFLAAIAGNVDNPSPSTTSASGLGATATTESRLTTTTQPTPTTTTPPVTTTTTVAPAPKPADPQPPNPKTTTKRTTPATPAPPPPPAEPTPNCDPNYSGCVPIASDVDCAGGSGNGPAYVKGPIRVIGTDIYDLDRDNNGIGCE